MILAVAYTPSGASVADVSTTVAYSAVTDYVIPDYVSGAGIADILPHMGLSTITLPVYAVIDLETAAVLYFQDGNGSGPDGSLSHILAADAD